MNMHVMAVIASIKSLWKQLLLIQGKGEIIYAGTADDDDDDDVVNASVIKYVKFTYTSFCVCMKILTDMSTLKKIQKKK